MRAGDAGIFVVDFSGLVWLNELAGGLVVCTYVWSESLAEGDTLLLSSVSGPSASV